MKKINEMIENTLPPTIGFTGSTVRGDSLMQWQAAGKYYEVTICREWRNLENIHIACGTQFEAHALFLALTRATRVALEGEDRKTEKK